MAFLDQMALANDADFRTKVAMAALTAAMNIASEGASPGTQDYHARRLVLANQVIADPINMATRLSYIIAAAPAINAASTDSDIQFTMNAAWDSLAGIPESARPAAP